MNLEFFAYDKKKPMARLQFKAEAVRLVNDQGFKLCRRQPGTWVIASERAVPVGDKGMEVTLPRPYPGHGQQGATQAEITSLKRREVRTAQ